MTKIQTFQNFGYTLSKIKYTIFMVLLCCFGYLILLFLGFQNIYAEKSQRGWYGTGSTPINILGDIKDKVNEDSKQYYIHDTKFDGVHANGSYDSQYKITNTVDYVRKNIHYYLQWMMYIGLGIATILLIVQGFLMVTNAVHRQGELSIIKKNLLKIFLGVFLMTAFLGFIQVILSLIVTIFGE